MTLSRRGRDYIGGTSLALLITSIAGPPISAALAFALALVAAFSILLMWYSARKIRISVKPKKLRVFKHESESGVITLESGTPHWLRLTSLSLGGVAGLSERTKEIGARSFEFTVAPSYAGRFELPTAKFSTGDLMGLFVGQVTLPLGLTVECLPLSLLSRVHTADVSPLTIGENPVGRKGSGQELYSIGEYLPNTDTKDILWKRVARAEDESMPIRVREANVRASVTLAVALGWKSEDERTRTVDLALEAIAQIGTTLLSVGTSLSIAYPAGKSLAVEDGSTVSELADALIETAGTVNAVPDESMRDLALECDLLLMTRDKAESRALGMTRSKPVLVLSEQPTSVGSTDASVFTGTEDLSGLTMMVLSR